MRFLPSGEVSPLIRLPCSRVFPKNPERTLPGEWSSPVIAFHKWMGDSLPCSGDEGGVEVTDELNGSVLIIISQIGSEVNLVVGESSSELSDNSLLKSEFRLVVSKLWPSDMSSVLMHIIWESGSSFFSHARMNLVQSSSSRSNLKSVVET